MEEPTPNAISTQTLMGWYNEERVEFEKLQEELLRMKEVADQDPDRRKEAELLATRIQDRAELLQSFAAFLMIESADVAGQLQVPDQK